MSSTTEVQRVSLEYTILGYRFKVVEYGRDGRTIEQSSENYRYGPSALSPKATTMGWTQDPESAMLYADPAEASAEIQRILALPKHVDSSKVDLDMYDGFDPSNLPRLVANTENLELFRADQSDEIRAEFVVEPVVEIKPVLQRRYEYKMQLCDLEGNVIERPAE